MKVFDTCLHPTPGSAAPLQTVLAAFVAHGFPVGDITSRDVNDRQRRFGILACREPPELSIHPPDPLRHVSGFPGRRLLPGLRHREADPNGVTNLVGDLAFHTMQRIETGLGRQLIP